MDNKNGNGGETVESEVFLSIILPAYNEENRIEACIRKVNAFIAEQNYSIEVLIVENGSSDNTLQMARNFAKEYPWLKVFKEDLPGKGRAVRRGMMEAKGKYRLFADVDFSMPIEEINHFFPPMKEPYQVAIGSREAKGSIRYNEPAFRHFTGRVFNWIVRIIAVPGLHDTQCGFKCFTAEAAETLFSLQVLDGWAFDAEVLFIAQHLGYRIVEIPIQWYYDANSKVNVLSDSIKMFKELLQIRKNYQNGLYNRKAA